MQSSEKMRRLPRNWPVRSLPRELQFYRNATIHKNRKTPPAEYCLCRGLFLYRKAHYVPNFYGKVEEAYRSGYKY